MKIAVCFLLALAGFSCGARAVDLTWNRSLQKGSGQELIKAYKHMTEPLPCRSMPTDGFSIQRPAFKAVLGRGTLLAEADGLGLVRGLFYEGDGTLSFEVEDPVERAHLKLFLGQDSIQDQHVDGLYILPLGSGSGLPMIPEGPLAVPNQTEYERFKTALHVDGLDLLTSLLNERLQGKEDLEVLFRLNGYIWSYVLNSRDDEEVCLRRLGTPPGIDFWWWDATVSLHRDEAGALTHSQTRQEIAAKCATDVLHYDIHIQLDGGGTAQEGTGVSIQAQPSAAAQSSSYAVQSSPQRLPRHLVRHGGSSLHQGSLFVHALLPRAGSRGAPSRRKPGRT